MRPAIGMGESLLLELANGHKQAIIGKCAKNLKAETYGQRPTSTDDEDEPDLHEITRLGRSTGGLGFGRGAWIYGA